MKYQEEKLKTYLKEALPMMVDNNNEVNLFGEPLSLDFETYLASEEAGGLKSYTVRTEENKLVGYCLFFISNHTHHKGMMVAHQDVIYVDPIYRTCGIRLLRYTESELKTQGVNLIIQAAPKISRLGKVLERLKYEEMETLYIRRL